MATTPNYGWVMPDPTDFVTDLPADFEIFGDAVDLTLDGIETKLDVITTEGDLIIGDATGVPVRLPVGAAGEVLTSDGDTVSFVAPAGAPETAYTLLTSSTTTGASTVTLSFTGCSDLLLNVVCTAPGNGALAVRLNGISTALYDNFSASHAQSGLTGYSLSTNNSSWSVTGATNGTQRASSMVINGANKAGFATFHSQSYFTSAGGGITTITNSGILRSNGPITSISLIDTFGGNFSAMNAKVYGRA